MTPLPATSTYSWRSRWRREAAGWQRERVASRSRTVHQLTRWVRLDAESVRRYLLLRTANHRWAHEAARLSCSVFQFHRVFPLLANPLLRLRDSVKRSRRRPGATNIVEVDRFGPEIDELWERTRGGLPGDLSARCAIPELALRRLPGAERIDVLSQGAAAGQLVTSSSDVPSRSNCRRESSLTCTPLARILRRCRRPGLAQPRVLRRGCCGGRLRHLGRGVRGRATEARLLQNLDSSSDLRLPRQRAP